MLKIKKINNYKNFVNEGDISTEYTNFNQLTKRDDETGDVESKTWMEKDDTVYKSEFMLRLVETIENNILEFTNVQAQIKSLTSQKKSLGSDIRTNLDLLISDMGDDSESIYTRYIEFLNTSFTFSKLAVEIRGPVRNAEKILKHLEATSDMWPVIQNVIDTVNDDGTKPYMKDTKLKGGKASSLVNIKPNTKIGKDGKWIEPRDRSLADDYDHDMNEGIYDDIKTAFSSWDGFKLMLMKTFKKVDYNLAMAKKLTEELEDSLK